MELLEFQKGSFEQWRQVQMEQMDCLQVKYFNEENYLGKDQGSGGERKKVVYLK